MRDGLLTFLVYVLTKSGRWIRILIPIAHYSLFREEILRHHPGHWGIHNRILGVCVRIRHA